MKHTLLVAIVLLVLTGSIFALTGFGVSGPFTITNETLPVELSSFTAQSTVQNYVRLLWTTQSESNLQGYYLYRDDSATLSEALMCSGLIQATNSSSLHSYEYTDMEIYQSGTYYYWLHSLEMDGNGSYHGPITILINLEGDNPEIPEIPVETGLRAIYPNPFNPNTTISYQLQTPETVSLSIYNLRGQMVQTFSRSHNAAGIYAVVFDGRDSQGNAIASGVYHVIMSAGKHISTRHIVLMK
jgi:hypothetical protein